MSDIWLSIPSEKSRFEKWWAEFSAQFKCPPTPTWREIASAAWQASKES